MSTALRLGHTSGPWVAKPLNDEFFKDVNILNDDGLACAVALVQGDITEDVAKANANLIAAAPDLLAALCEYMIMGVGKCTIGKATADKALAAISKATGR